jgi:hypothetical protein
MNMRILILYNATQTFTQTVFEHLDAFRNHSEHEWFYLHWEGLNAWESRLDAFDAIVVHYSVRFPFEVHEEMARVIASFHGVKAAFLQDEYDGTNRAKYWLQRTGVDIVFTVVPEPMISRIYTPEEFPRTIFCNVFTGYVPENLPSHFENLTPTHERPLIIGYRGRVLPIQYGALGREKFVIAEYVKKYCTEKGITHDIECSDESRIYGDKWYRFIASCKAMLGTESGSNVFDWKGTLAQDIAAFRKMNRSASVERVYEAVVQPLELPGAMNQISPRIFEMAAARTVMVLFEGAYSGVIQPNVHFIPLRKDFSNLPDVFERLNDDAFVSNLTESAYAHVVSSGCYSYAAFVRKVDAALSGLLTARDTAVTRGGWDMASYADLRRPIAAPPPVYLTPFRRTVCGLSIKVWASIPLPLRDFVRPVARRVRIAFSSQKRPR